MVLALVCAALTGAVLIKTQADAAVAGREADAYKPRPSTITAVSGPVIAVIGDGSTTRGPSGRTEEKIWPRLVEASLKVRLTAYCGDGCGYTVAGSNGATYVDSVTEVPASTDLIVFVGGAEDARASRLAIAQAATQAFAEAGRQAPQAQVIAIGPLSAPAAVSSAQMVKVRESLRSAARIADVQWVDPIADEWLDSASNSTADDEQEIATRVASHLRKALL